MMIPVTFSPPAGFARDYFTKAVTTKRRQLRSWRQRKGQLHALELSIMARAALCPAHAHSKLECLVMHRAGGLAALAHQVLELNLWAAVVVSAQAKEEASIEAVWSSGLR